MPPTGILLIDKPIGPTSANIVARVRRALSMKRVGHCGTLDPLASGLLVCMLGQATRLASYAEGGRKIYSGCFRLGLTTDSDDITGQVLTESGKRPAIEVIRAALPEFTGEISQVPPNVSAIKVNGQRAYALARAGHDVALKSRIVKIFSIEISCRDDGDIGFVIECGPGTYIRSIARDLGAQLGCGGCLSVLRREASHPFSVADAITPDSISEASVLEWQTLFPSVPRVAVSDTLARALLGGAVREVRAFGQECEQAGVLSSVDRYLVYSRERTGKSLGLLCREPDGFRVAVNIGDVEL